MRTIAMILGLLVPLGISGVVSAAPDAGQEETPPPLKVLFLGNSYTHANRLPSLVAGLADAAGGRKIETAEHTRGGFTLEKHLEEGGAAEAIGKQKWDVVVLQEQSLRPVAEKDLMHAAARRLYAEIRKQGAEPVFFLTWARQDQPEMQRDLDAAYFGIAAPLGAKVAPVGLAWQQALRADPKRVLHADDGSHPNPAGSYLAACVFYATLLDASPVGLPGQLSRDGKPLVALDPQLAGQLQEVAWKTVEDVRAGRLPEPQRAPDLASPVRIEAAGAPIDTDIGHAAPFVGDFDGDGTADLLVGQFGEGKLRIYRNQGTDAQPKLQEHQWFKAGADLGRIPSG